MEYYRGRLIDHLHLRVKDLEASKRFYRAALAALRGDLVVNEGEGYFFCDELWVDAAGESGVSRVHLAFQASDRAAVDRFYQAALAGGGRDNGAPGERSYHPGYYAAYVFDPDNNNVEAVHHGPSTRSADSVAVKAG